MPRTLTLALLATLLFAPPATAQLMARLLNPQVTVTLDHPPDLGLNFSRVAFPAAHGTCSTEFVNALIEDFLDQGIEVIDRHHLQRILEEHDFALSHYVDRNTAVELGQILGPSALVLVDVTRCATELSSSYKDYPTNDGSQRHYYATVRGYFKASVQIADLQTGRIFRARTVSAEAQLRNESESGYPEYPSEFAVRDDFLRDARLQVFRLLFPWTEKKTLTFFNDDRCNLKDAYRLLKIGDIQGTAARSLQNLEQCKSDRKAKTKNLAHAYYNVGMTHMIQGQHEEALPYFQQGYQIKPGSIFQEAMDECQRARQLAEELQEYETAMEIAMENEAAPEESNLSERSEPPSSQILEASSTSSRSIEDRLVKLRNLLDKGLITESEYQEKRAEILEGL
jgi:tetratricopeptide (TPR) repeat protein